MARKRTQVRESEDLREVGLRYTDRQQAYRESLLRGDYKDELYIDPSIIPPDMEYLWATETLLGAPADSNLATTSKRGYEPVPASRHPEMCTENFMGRGFRNEGTIVRKGLMLCERPKELGQLERYKLAEYNLRLLKDLKGTENILGDPAVPLLSMQNETKFSEYGH